jgi:predicted amidohydrolase
MQVALCQLPINSDKKSTGRVRDALREAAAAGAELAVFPEATMIRFGRDLRAAAEPLDGPFCHGLQHAAAGTGVALVAGVFEPAPDGRVYNTAFACDANGEPVAAYRKIHLYDALGQRESELVAPGGEPVIVPLAGLRVGLLTCYDVRFPELSRALAAGGADASLLPAAWARAVQEEHWVTLVRAGRSRRDLGGRRRAGARPGRRTPACPPASAAACWSTR